jgi:teichuronic acid exporter
MSVLSDLGRRVFWWQQILYVLSFARAILLMKWIGPTDFGVFALATTLASYVGFLKAFDFRAPFIASKELNPQMLSTQFVTEIGISFVSLLALFGLSPWIQATHGEAVFLALLILLCVNVLEALYSTPLYLAERNLEFPVLTRWRAWINIFSFAVTVFMALRGFGVWSLVTDRVLNAGLLGILVWRRTSWKTAFRWDRESMLYFVRFGKVLFGCGLLGMVFFSFDLFMLGTFWTKEDTGLYSRAIAWGRLPMEIGAGFLSMMALAVYSAGARSSIQEVIRTHRELTFHIARITTWMAGLMAILIGDLVPLVFGQEWVGITPFFLILVPYAVARPLFQNSAQCLVALHEQWSFFKVLLVLSIAYAVGLFFSVGKSPLWVAYITSLLLVLGYLFIERQVIARLGASSWRTIFIPALLLLLALGGLWLIGSRVPTDLQLGAKIFWSALYSGIVFWEWKTFRSRFHQES